jgi:hypothetical protein
MRRATPNMPSNLGALGNVQDGDEGGDLEEVPANITVRNKQDLYNTA